MFNYSDAFKKLSLLEQETFPVSTQGLSDLKDFLNKDAEEPQVVDVIDTAAQNPKDLEDSYDGKIILQCPVCSSLLYKANEEVNVDPESEEGLANTNEECPYCFTTQGFKIIGKVAPFEGEEEVEVEVVPSEESDDQSSVEDDMDKEENDADLAPIDFDSTALDKQMSYADDEKKKMLEDEDIVECLNEEISEDQLVESDEEELDNTSADSIWSKIVAKWPELGSANECLKEGVQSADVDLDDDKSLNLSVDGGSLDSASLAMDDGKTVNLKVVEKNADENAEMIAPLDDTDKEGLLPEPEIGEDDLIDDGSEEGSEEDMSFEEPDDFQDFEMSGDEKDKFKDELMGEALEDENIDEFETESFDKQFNDYLHDSFDNVDNYESSKIEECGDNSLMLEGLITFKNGTTKKTNFKIMPETITKDKKATFICENLQMHNKIQISGKIENGIFK